jgi:DNA-binding transcriptional ArsR family regulator
VPRVTAEARDAGELLLKAIANPLRQRILAAINEGDATSPNEVSRRLGEPLGRVSHHVRVLAKLGAIELVRTEPRRGAVEHYYRALVRPWFDDAEWDRLPLSVRRTLFGHPLERLLRDIPEAARGTGFDHPRAHVSYSHFDLDEAGMDELADLLGETLDRAQAIAAAARDRLGDDEPAVRTEMGIVHFERP